MAGHVFANEPPTGEIRAARGRVITCMRHGGIAGDVRSGTRRIHGKVQSPAAATAADLPVVRQRWDEEGTNPSGKGPRQSLWSVRGGQRLPAEVGGAVSV